MPLVMGWDTLMDSGQSGPTLGARLGDQVHPELSPGRHDWPKRLVEWVLQTQPEYAHHIGIKFRTVSIPALGLHLSLQASKRYKPLMTMTIPFQSLYHHL